MATKKAPAKTKAKAEEVEQKVTEPEVTEAPDLGKPTYAPPAERLDLSSDVDREPHAEKPVSLLIDDGTGYIELASVSTEFGAPGGQVSWLVVSELLARGITSLGDSLADQVAKDMPQPGEGEAPPSEADIARYVLGRVVDEVAAVAHERVEQIAQALESGVAEEK